MGIHTGRGIAAYRQIILANGGVFEGIRFRRAPSLRAAQELFLSEAAQHGVDPLRVKSYPSMGLKEGTTAFLKLEDFEPPWRQAVLLANPGSGKKLIFAVRVTATETRSAESSGFSFFECSGEKFMLVEGQQSQIRNNCPRELRGVRGCSTADLCCGKGDLGAEPGLAVRHCLGGTSSRHSNHPSSGSEDKAGRKLGGGHRAGGRSWKRGRCFQDATESPEAWSRKGFEFRKRSKRAAHQKSVALSALRGKGNQQPKKESFYQWLGSPSSTEHCRRFECSQPRKREPYGPDGAPQSLKGKSKKEKLSSAQGDQDDSDCSSLESSSSHGKRGGASRALREYRRGHREMRRNPKKHIRRYIKEVEHHLGATKDTPYQLSDDTKRLNWGKSRGVYFESTMLPQKFSKLCCRTNRNWLRWSWCNC